MSIDGYNFRELVRIKEVLEISQAALDDFAGIEPWQNIGDARGEPIEKDIL